MKLHSPAPRARVLFVLATCGTLVSLLVPAALGAAQDDPQAEPVSTFSIVAYDPETGDLGVAVQSKFFAVGPVVPFAAADVGAIATQSFANVTYGQRGLDMLSKGLSAEAAIRELTEADDLRDQRQVGIVDANGNAATFTGERCLSWAGGYTGEHFAAQGNILAGPEVVEAMAAAFEVTEGDLATRLVAALAAGQAAGGDARGRQSAALVVVREGGGYGGSDRYIDLRVDDHPQPIRELQRLLDMRHGQMASGEANGHLQQASEAAGEARTAQLQAALEAAELSTRLYPHNEFGWLTLARAHLELGNKDAAAAAAIRALQVNPWLKTAVVRGTFGRGPGRIVERLLEIASFRRVWESIPAQ